MTTYTETAENAAIRNAGADHVVKLDDVRDRYAPAITEALARLQTTNNRARALVDLREITELAAMISEIARDARVDLKNNPPAR